MELGSDWIQLGFGSLWIGMLTAENQCQSHGEASLGNEITLNNQGWWWRKLFQAGNHENVIPSEEKRGVICGADTEWG